MRTWKMKNRRRVLLGVILMIGILAACSSENEIKSLTQEVSVSDEKYRFEEQSESTVTVEQEKESEEKQLESSTDEAEKESREELPEPSTVEEERENEEKQSVNPSDEDEAEEKYYTTDNLPKGYFIKQDDCFYPFTAEMSEKVSAGILGDYFTVKAADYSDDIFLSLPQNAVFAFKGDNYDIPTIREIRHYGYTFNAYFHDSYYPNSIETIVGDTWYKDIYFVNDVEQSIYDYAENNGWVEVPTHTAETIYLGEFSPEDSIKIGYYQGTEFLEKELYADLWYAHVNLDVHGAQGIWNDYLSVERTTEGYFKLIVPTVPHAGLYMLDFEGRIGAEGKILVWIQ